MEDEWHDCDEEQDFNDALSDQLTEALSRVSTQEAEEPEENGTEASDRLADGQPKYGRTSLPVAMFSRSDFSIWSILKQCIGKELSKITMPVVFNEPLSFVQRLAEYMEYAPLLEQAATEDDPVTRLEYISAFAVSALSSNWERIGKPFNPLLGETYELDRPDLGFRFVGEQVSHHPPVTAFHAQGKGFAFHGSIQPKLKFWGKTVEIVPKGNITLELFKYNETYSWQNVNFNVHNIIVGQLWVEHCGSMEIACPTSPYKAVLTFKQCGWFSKGLHQVEGHVYNGKKKMRALYGNWVLGLYSCSVDAYDAYQSSPDAKKAAKEKPDKGSKGSDDKGQGAGPLLSYNFNIAGQQTLWKANSRPHNAAKYYHFSVFAMCLNETSPSLQTKLPPTDSRLRPDIRSMEDGKIDLSAEEKNRLEEKQRESRKERKKSTAEWTPVWFSPAKSQGGKDTWSFQQNYWDRNWKVCPDIF